MTDMTDRVKGLVERVVWTAAQAAVGYVSAPEVIDIFGIDEGLRGVVTVAIAALASYVKNKAAEKLNGTHRLGVK